MYLLLTGHMAGMALGLFIKSLITGSVSWLTLFGMALIAFWVFAMTAELEGFVPDAWKNRIAARRAAGELSRWFCFGLGGGMGLVLYPLQWFLWKRILENFDSVDVLALVLAGLSVIASVCVGWYLLTKYPKARTKQLLL